MKSFRLAFIAMVLVGLLYAFIGYNGHEIINNKFWPLADAFIIGGLVLIITGIIAIAKIWRRA